MMILRTATVKCEAGDTELWFGDRALVGLAFDDRVVAVRKWLARRFGPFREEPANDTELGVTAVERYFEGDIHALDAIRVDTGGTDFQRAVWTALRGIPAGKTTTYGAIAETIGRPRAVRAVGVANGDNPVAIVVPCHRVIGKDGSLTGYASGLARKEWLLAHECRPGRRESGDRTIERDATPSGRVSRGAGSLERAAERTD